MEFKYRSLLKIKSVNNKKNDRPIENSLNKTLEYDFIMIEKMKIQFIA